MFIGLFVLLGEMSVLGQSLFLGWIVPPAPSGGGGSRQSQELFLGTTIYFVFSNKWLSVAWSLPGPPESLRDPPVLISQALGSNRNSIKIPVFA